MGLIAIVGTAMCAAPLTATIVHDMMVCKRRHDAEYIHAAIRKQRSLK